LQIITGRILVDILGFVLTLEQTFTGLISSFVSELCTRCVSENELEIIIKRIPPRPAHFNKEE
jgi:hypothetical protein